MRARQRRKNNEWNSSTIDMNAGMIGVIIRKNRERGVDTLETAKELVKQTKKIAKTIKYRATDSVEFMRPPSRNLGSLTALLRNCQY